MEIPQRAGTGVWLGTAPLLVQWRERMVKPIRANGSSPHEWFLHLGAISDDRPDIFERKPVPVSRLADAVGAGRDVVDEGTIFTAYDEMWRALDLGAEPSPSLVPARARLYQQARMATFLRYRDGFTASLSALPFTAEAAIHGYFRVVLEWARQWPGLTLSDSSEREREQADFPPALRRGANRDRFLRLTRFSVPLIVRQDLSELFRLARLESSEVGSTSSVASGDDLAVDVMEDHLRFAASHVVQDPTLSALGASNFIRVYANEALGGALLRMRIRPQDEALVQTRVLEQVRRWMVTPRVDRVAAGEMSKLLAELETTLTSLSVMRRVFAGGGSDD
ncbi:hypothetical protein ACIQLJ_12000 [Microbacterium sp. NPDC091313]